MEDNDIIDNDNVTSIENDTDDKNNDVQAIKIASDDPKEPTRMWLVYTYVLGFFGVILFCFIYAFVFSCCDFSSGDLKELLLTSSGILSGPLGFVFGYYFKNGEK